MKVKAGVTLGCIVLISSLALFWAAKQGEEKFLYAFQPFERTVPLPLLFDHLEGRATLLGDGRIQAEWGKVDMPKSEEQKRIQCVGRIHPGTTTTYYVLDLDGALYLEKADFVEPLIYALLYLDRGRMEGPRPDTIEEVLDSLPRDEDRLLELSAQLKPVVVK